MPFSWEIYAASLMIPSMNDSLLKAIEEFLQGRSIVLMEYFDQDFGWLEAQ